MFVVFWDCGVSYIFSHSVIESYFLLQWAFCNNNPYICTQTGQRHQSIMAAFTYSISCLPSTVYWFVTLTYRGFWHDGRGVTSGVSLSLSGLWWTNDPLPVSLGVYSISVIGRAPPLWLKHTNTPCGFWECFTDVFWQGVYPICPRRCQEEGYCHFVSRD